MAEPERVSTTTPPSESPQDLRGPSMIPAPPNAAIEAERPEEFSRGMRSRLVLLAGLGAFVGCFTGTGFYTESREFSWFALIAVTAGAATFFVFDPIREWRPGQPESPRPESPGQVRQNRSFVTLMAIFAIFLIAALEHSLVTGLEVFRSHLFGAQANVTEPGAKWLWVAMVLAFAAFACTAGPVTLRWRHGAQRKPPRAAVHGATAGILSGVIQGAVVAGIVMLLDKVFNHTILPQQWNGTTLRYAAFFALAVVGSGVSWLLSGMAGGLAIDRFHLRLSPMFGILCALSALSLTVLILAWLSNGALPWLLGALLAGLNVGWGLVLYFQRESLDAHFNPAGALRAALPEPALGPRKLDSPSSVLPFPGPPRSGPPEAAELPEKPIPPQVLLLRPTGSRAWALVVLVIALLVTLLVYATGVLRTDPEIIAEIKARFQQDSGLHNKALSIQCLDRVVTVAGAVNDSVQRTTADQLASVRGVKQLVDQLQVVAAVVPAPAIQTNTVLVPALPPPASTNPTVSIVVPQGQGKAGTTGAQKHGFFHLPAKVNQATSAGAPKAPDSQKPGFFHFLKKSNDKTDKNKKDKTKNDPSH